MTRFGSVRLTPTCLRTSVRHPEPANIERRGCHVRTAMRVLARMTRRRCHRGLWSRWTTRDRELTGRPVAAFATTPELSMPAGTADCDEHIDRCERGRNQTRHKNNPNQFHRDTASPVTSLAVGVSTPRDSHASRAIPDLLAAVGAKVNIGTLGGLEAQRQIGWSRSVRLCEEPTRPHS
jgi:hypothetical protein